MKRTKMLTAFTQWKILCGTVYLLTSSIIPYLSFAAYFSSVSVGMGCLKALRAACTRQKSTAMAIRPKKI
jgi:hypothetical protein